MYKIYIDGNWGRGPVTSGFARYTRGLLDGFTSQPDCPFFALRFLTNISHDVAHDPQWITAPDKEWMQILNTMNKTAYHDLTNGEDLRLKRRGSLPHNCDLFITMHDTISLIYYLMHEVPDEAEIYRTEMAHLFHQAKAIVTVSHASKEAICEQFPTVPPKKIHAIYPGIESCFRPIDREHARRWCSRFNVNPEKPFILNSGAYHPHKNLRSLLYGFALVKEQIPDLQLVLTGAMRPDHAAFWYPILLKLKIEDDVIITGRVTDVDLGYFYSAADVFAYPSLVEGFGLPPVEAEYCGASVIAADIPVFREVLSEETVLVPPLDYEAWSDAILQSLAEPLDSIGIAHPRRPYNWTEAAHQYCELYAECYRNASGGNALEI